MATFKKGVVQVVDRYDINMDLEVLKFDVPARTIPTGQAHAHETCYLIRLSDARRLSEQADAEVEDSARTHEFARMTILTWYQFACLRIEVDIVADAPFNRTWATTSDTFNYPEPQAE
jgi:hypothetical protein